MYAVSATSELIEHVLIAYWSSTLDKTGEKVKVVWSKLEHLTDGNNESSCSNHDLSL